MSTIEMSYMEVGDDVVEIVDAKSRNDIKQLSVNKDDLYRVKADSIKRTFEGETILLDDCSNNGFDGLRVFGRSEQASTNGYQLFDEDSYPFTDGIWVNHTNGIYSYSDSYKATADYIPFSQYIGKTLYINKIPGGSNPGMAFYNSNLTYISGVKSNVFVVPENTTYMRFAVNADDEEVMINIGDKPLPYEPYTGGKPSPSVEFPQSIESIGDDGSVDVGVYGKNLLNNVAKTQTINGVTFTVNDDKSVTVKGTATANTSLFVVSEGNRKNIKSGTYLVNGSDGDATKYKMIVGITGVGEYSQAGSDTEIVVDSDNTYYARILVYSGASVDTTIYPMIRLASITDGTYEPYKEPQSLSISTPSGLPGIKVTDPSLATYTDQNGIMWCADEVDFARGKYVKRVNKLVLDGVTEGHKMTGADGNNSDKYGHNFAYILVKDKLLGGVFMANVGKSTSHYSVEGIISTSVNTSVTLTLSDEKTGLTADDSKTVIVNKINAWLTENPVTIIYQLAEPIETDLTQAELDSYKALHSNYLNTTILNESNARMEVVYSADTATYLDNTYGKAIKHIDDINTIKRTYLGDAIVATDSADAKFEGLKVFGRSEQFSTTGKQLLPYPYVDTTKTVNGVTFTDNGDGTITVNGTATGQVNFVLMSASAMSGTFTISGCPSGGHSNRYSIQLKIDGVWNVENYDTGSGKKITVNNEITTALIVIASGTTVNNLVFKPMLNEGSTPLPYEPYTGGKPSPNPDYPQPINSVGDDGSVDVGVYGDNLLPYPYRGSSTTSNGGTMNIQEDGGIACSGTPTGYIGIELYKKDIPCNKFRVCLLGNAKNVILEVHMIDANNNNCLTSGTSIALGKSILFDVKDYPTATKFYVGIKRNDSNIAMSGTAYPMIVAGDVVPKEYKSYIKQSLSISTPNGLPGIKVTDESIATYTDTEGNMWVSDEVDFARGKYVQRIGRITLNGTEPWFAYDNVNTAFGIGSSRDYPMLDNVIYVDTSKYNICGKCNYFIYTTYVEASKMQTGTFCSYTGKTGKTLCFKCDNITNLEDWKSFVAQKYAEGNPLEIIFRIEPIETNLTSEQLEAYRALTSNYPTTTIINDESAYTEVTLVADTKNHIEQNYVPVDSYKALEARVLAIEKALA